SIFEQTKEWLNESDDNIFHLIIDELHLYRGTQGTEVAYLIRILLQRLGLTPESKQLRILASSASLEPNDVKSQEFLKDFFGVEFAEDQIITGASEEIEQKLTDEDYNIDALTAITGAYDKCNGNPLEDESFIQACSKFAESADGVKGAIIKLHRAGFRNKLR